MFSGIVVHAKKIGRTLGYPTANLDIPSQSTGLSDGVYTVRAELSAKRYQGVLALKHATNLVEIHLFDYDGDDFYGSVLTVEPLQKISPILNLTGPAIQQKIAADIAKAREWFEAHGKV